MLLCGYALKITLGPLLAATATRSEFVSPVCFSSPPQCEIDEAADNERKHKEDPYMTERRRAADGRKLLRCLAQRRPCSPQHMLHSVQECVMLRDFFTDGPAVGLERADITNECAELLVVLLLHFLRHIVSVGVLLGVSRCLLSVHICRMSPSASPSSPTCLNTRRS